ncbi:hypothetical protein MHU86_11318 [Fragilaria crotonensis]|nr:hypothetical protein MHU86_11318 [Fragilaria crotonensis]
MASAMEHFLPGWALNNANADQSERCPNLAVITPSEVYGFKKWFMMIKGKKKYKVVFYCEHSGGPGHEPFEITVDKKWLLMVAPWLRIVLNIAAALDPTHVLQAVNSEFHFFSRNERMEALVDELGNEEHDDTQTLQLQGHAYMAIARKANKKKNKQCWRPGMVPVTNTEGKTSWVKQEFENEYRYRLSVD